MKTKYNYYSNNELLQLLRDKAKELGKSPTRRDIGKENNMPSDTYYYHRFNTKSWNKILQLAGLKVNHFQGYTKEECINKLRYYYQVLGKVPKKKDFEDNKWLPSIYVYNKLFNGLTNACVEAGLIEKPLSEKERIKISLFELIKLGKKLGRFPTVYEYDSIKHKGYQRRVLETKLNMKYNDICRKYLPQYKENINFDVTKEELINILINIKNKLGRVPTFKELKNFGCSYTYKVFQRIFQKSYTDIIKELGWQPTVSPVIIRSKEQLLNDFYFLFKKLNRIPYVSDFNNNKNIASYSTYMRYFGNIKNICDLLDIDYDLYYQNAGAGKICIDKNGNLCKSLIEKRITDFLIDNNIKFKKEVSYSEIIKGDKRRFDWRIQFGEIYFYVEYFGMYRRNPKGYVGKRYNNNVKKKIKDIYKSGNIDKCIFIFPDDIKNNLFVQKILLYQQKYGGECVA
jgi:hypothetical protein